MFEESFCTCKFSVDKFPFKKWKLGILFLLIVLLICSCEKDKTTEEIDITKIDYGSKVNTIEEIGTVTKDDAAQNLLVAQQLLGISFDIEPTYGFDMYRFIYQTTNYDNSKIWVSGLVGVPDTREIKGLLSYQHGTTPDRTMAPSGPSIYEGLALTSVFAADGYLFIAADYIGLGTSEETPTYMHTESTVNAVVDLISIGEIILNELTNGTNNKLFLMGFSQGGHATAAVQRSLESNNPTNLDIAASACVAGAYNLLGIELPFIIEQNNTYFTAYLTNSYAKIYNQPINSIIKNEWADSLPIYFDGSKSSTYITEMLPPKIDSLMQDSFLNDIENGTDNWLTLALKENETYNWKPVNPLRIYYGDADKSTSPRDAITTHQHMIDLGGNVDIFNIGSYDHMNTIYNSVPIIQDWFNEN